MNDLVTIITPSYNSALYIDKTIESVLSQTYTKWEMLLIDDSSSDDSPDIIKSYMSKDSRIKYLKTDQPSGSPTLPRNIGIQNANGRYIAFLDSDDIWLSTKLERQIALLDKSKNVAIAFSNYEKISEEGIRSDRVIIAPSYSISYRKLLKGNIIGCLTVMYDTHKIEKPYFQKIGHEDYVAWLSILKQGFFAQNTNSVEALYRVRKNSVSANKLRGLIWQWNIYRNVEKMNIFRSAYYFIFYACKAAQKRMI